MRWKLLFLVCLVIGLVVGAIYLFLRKPSNGLYSVNKSVLQSKLKEMGLTANKVVIEDSTDTTESSYSIVKKFEGKLLFGCSPTLDQKSVRLKLYVSDFYSQITPEETELLTRTEKELSKLVFSCVALLTTNPSLYQEKINSGDYSSLRVIQLHI